jgi:hypothetical protein
VAPPEAQYDFVDDDYYYEMVVPQPATQQDLNNYLVRNRIINPNLERPPSSDELQKLRK